MDLGLYPSFIHDNETIVAITNSFYEYMCIYSNHVSDTNTWEFCEEIKTAEHYFFRSTRFVNVDVTVWFIHRHSYYCSAVLLSRYWYRAKDGNK